MRVLLLLFLSLPAMAEPGVFFSPMSAADGSKTFRFVGPWNLTKDEAALKNALTGEMGKARWCEYGWQETSRQKASGFLVIEGRCLTR